MFLEMGKPDDETLRQVVGAFVPWMISMMERDRYVCWVLETPAGERVATAGMLILDWAPNRADFQPLRAYLMNVYVDPRHRRRGLARWLVEVALEEARRRKIVVCALHASDEGRMVYESFDFRPSREMIRVEGSVKK